MPVACPVCGFANPDGMKFCGSCGTRLAPANAEGVIRRLATILFADVTGSTAIGERVDPETLRAIMNRYFATMRSIIESHGGSVEKFIGDAVMAVFGVPQMHEDDALRAVRAAAEIGEALAVLNADLELERGFSIRFRTGVHTGEVVVGDPATGTTLITGDTVNTAARLEQGAPPGGILLGRLTYTLVRDAVVTEAVQPIAAKGKAEPVEAHRLISVRTGVEGHSRHLEARLVGRELELDRLDEVYRRVVTDRTCEMLTLLAPAGIGKSRLTEAFLASIEGEATILRGRCLSYGAGITYWPIADLVRGAAGIVDADSVDRAVGKVRALFGDLPDADELTANVASAIGLSTAAVPGEAISWAVRRMLERLAEARPVVAVVEDIHWAEPALLDLLEEVADWASDVPLLLLCPARPELLEVRPTWAAGRVNATTLRLEPLGSDATARLIEDLPGGLALPASVADRVVATADGNPLFVEELLAMLVDEGVLHVGPDGTWEATSDVVDLRIPPSISALLGARLQGLGPPERLTAQRASVVGRTFDRTAVLELSPELERELVPGALSGLVRKEIVRPDGADQMTPSYTFRHALIRDAAYEALSKGERADLHARFADLVERTSGERLAEVEEIVGYHYEQARRYLVQLGGDDERARRLGDRASALLGGAGERAFRRTDHAAAANLLDRARGLASDPSDRARHGDKLAISLFQLQRFPESVEVANAAVEEARAAGLGAVAANASLTALGVRELAGDIAIELLWAEINDARREFEAVDDDEGLSRIALLESYLYSREGREGESLRAAKDAAQYAETAGNLHRAARALANAADSYVFGPWKVRSAITEVERGLAIVRADPDAYYQTAGCLAAMHAMNGAVDRAHWYLREREATAEARGRTRARSDRIFDGYVAVILDDPIPAIDVVAAEYERYRLIGDDQFGRMLGYLLGELRVRTGDVRGAREVLAELGDRDDVNEMSGIVAAAVASAEGDHTIALRRAREAVDQIDTTEWLFSLGWAWMRLAEVTYASGDLVAAESAARRAIDLFDEKGNVAWGAQTRRLIANMSNTSPVPTVQLEP